MPANATGTICAKNQTVTVTAYLPPELGGTELVKPHVHEISVPDACTTVAENVSMATTTWDETTGWSTEVDSTCNDVELYMSSAVYHVESEDFLRFDLVALFLVRIDWTADFETSGGFEDAGVAWRFSNANYWPWAEQMEDYSTISVRPADAQFPIKQQCSGDRKWPFYKAGTPFPYQLVRHTLLHMPVDGKMF